MIRALVALAIAGVLALVTAQIRMGDSRDAGEHGKEAPVLAYLCPDDGPPPQIYGRELADLPREDAVAAVELLKDPNKSACWELALRLVAFAGPAELIDDLISFVEDSHTGPQPTTTFEAVFVAHHAIGMLVGRHSDSEMGRAGLEYLLKNANPDDSRFRRLQWQHPVLGTTVPAIHKSLAPSVLYALAMTGQPAALDVVKGAATDPRFTKGVRGEARRIGELTAEHGVVKAQQLLVEASGRD